MTALVQIDPTTFPLWRDPTFWAAVAAVAGLLSVGITAYTFWMSIRQRRRDKNAADYDRWVAQPGFSALAEFRAELASDCFLAPAGLIDPTSLKKERLNGAVRMVKKLSSQLLTGCQAMGDSPAHSALFEEINELEDKLVDEIEDHGATTQPLDLFRLFDTGAANIGKAIRQYDPGRPGN
ncbi:MAG: hypothetical protein QGM45_11445 [Anaerolineales bacterium]|nr:hypothetical protein [Anaerolineales bacterium]